MISSGAHLLCEIKAESDELLSFMETLDSRRRIIEAVERLSETEPKYPQAEKMRSRSKANGLR